MTMSALAIGAGFSGNSSVGSLFENGGSLQSNLQDTITRLEKERDKYQKQRESAQSEYLDNKISNLENRIDNLQKRLDKIKAEEDNGECETCKNRKYQDESNDPGVSFKTATNVSPASAESAVRAHENEHVTRNQAKAEREGREIVYQNVVIKRAICPECGTSYVAGGETTTVTRTKQEDERFSVGMYDKEQGKGQLLNIVA